MAFITGNPLTAGATPITTPAATPTTPTTAAATATAATTPVVTATANPNLTQVTDFRARLAPLYPADIYYSPAAMTSVNGAATGTIGLGAATGLMDILNNTGGVLFPYTPTIAFGQTVQYMDLQLVHSDTDYPAYTRTPTCTLTVTGKFTVQNQREGQYALAVIHFLRTVSKSYFGEADAKTGKAGLPPPVLVFSAYGTYVFNRLRCVLKSHSWSFDENMDTIAINVAAIGTSPATQVRLPAMFSITTELQVVQTPQRMRTAFSFDAFASGQLMGGDGGWV
jgi:hypothetical protein